MSKPQAIRFSDASGIPNNPRLPVLIYKNAVAFGDDPAASIEQMFEQNGWPPDWRNGIYDYHHYHSTAHEVLGIARGRVKVRLGGESGEDFELAAGDVVVLPAGTGHKRLSAKSGDLLVVGAYPRGQSWDLIRDNEPEKKEAAVARIAQVPLAPSDPVHGRGGPLLEMWIEARRQDRVQRRARRKNTLTSRLGKLLPGQKDKKKTTAKRKRTVKHTPKRATAGRKQAPSRRRKVKAKRKK